MTSIAPPERMHGLTAMRFIAALWVVLLHFRDNLPYDIDHWSPFIRNGVMGVDFFFMLSGFVLAHVYLPDMDRFDYKSFLVKRLARIYPMHFLTLLFMVIVAIATATVGIRGNSRHLFDLSQVPYQLFMLHAWGIGSIKGSLNWPSWSISAEWGAYLLFPLMAYPIMWLRPAVSLILAVALLSLWWLITYQLTEGSLTYLQTAGIFRILPEFFLGMALWRVRPNRAYGWLAAAGALAVFLILQFGGLRFAAFWGLALVIWAGCRLRAPSWLVLAGDASYSLYMIHLPIQILSFKGMEMMGIRLSAVPATIMFVAVIAISVAISVGCYMRIEVKARDGIIAHWRARRSVRAPVAVPYDTPIS